MRLRVALLVVISLLVATTSAAAAPVGHAGRWLTDGSGRVLVIHGVNMPSKSLPAYPAALGFDEDDAALLSSLGFNAVRLTVERYAVEPAAGRFDDAYIAHIADTIRLLAQHGIVTLVDFHQDEYGPVFFDNGYPGWMTQTDGLPNAYEVGFPAQYVANPALNRAYDHLWANDADTRGKGLQADDAEILARVTAELRDEPGVMGFEVINEPWPGSVYPTCVTPGVGCPVFDRGQFSAYYARTLGAMRAADPNHLLFYEPLVTFNYGIPTSVQPPQDKRLGFAFHDYSGCSASGDAGLPVSAGAACAPEDAMVLDNAERHSASTGSALLETEFGATFDTQTLNSELAAYDQHMTPWMFWSYTRYIDATTPSGALKPASGSNLNATMIKTLARPYPQLVAGTPAGWRFDPASGAFSFRYSTHHAAGTGRFHAGAETTVAVPSVQYPGGYSVAVIGGHVLSSAGAGVLRIAQCGHTEAVQVRVAPGHSISDSC